MHRFLFFFLLIPFLFHQSAAAQTKRYTFEKGLMGSPFKLVFYTSDDSLAQKAAQNAFKRIEQLNEIMSDYADGSEINRLSARSGSGEWVPVSKDLFAILAISQEISQKTNGAFDCTIGPVVQVWRRAVRQRVFPTKQEIREAKAKIGYRKMKLDTVGQKVLLTQPGMRLDIGGLGKGFAAEEAVKVLKTYGITSAMMDAGGKIVLTDAPPGAKGWKIVISNGSDSLKTLELANTTLATSGPTYRHLDFNGVRYSHIVDPKTGIGLRFHVRTTVIASDGTVSDALATAFSVSGIRKSKKLLKYFPGSKVWLVEIRNGRVQSWEMLE
ncbi:MAG: FAD:protein FMN transferase [Spirosomataceae bacterium]